MKKDLWFLILIVIAGGVYFFLKNKTPKKNLDEVKFIVNEDVKDLNHFSGDKLIIHYYAAWCGHCLQEMPELIEARSFFEEQGIRVVLLTDDKDSEIERIRNSKGIPYEIYSLENSLKSNGIRSIPTSYFYNKKGEQIYSFAGKIHWNTDEGKKLILDYF